MRAWPKCGGGRGRSVRVAAGLLGVCSVEVAPVVFELEAESVGVVRRSVGSADHEILIDEAGSDQ